MKKGTFASPKQFPTKSLANPIFRLLLGTDLQRICNGPTTEVKGYKLYCPILSILALPAVVSISSLSLFCHTCFTSSAIRFA